MDTTLAEDILIIIIDVLSIYFEVLFDINKYNKIKKTQFYPHQRLELFLE